MAILTIEILNDGGAARSYAVFSAPPEVTFENRPVKAHPCAWLVFDQTPAGGRVTSTFSESVYAFLNCPASLTPGIVAVDNTSVPADPRARDWIPVVQTRGFFKFGETTQGKSAYGTFSLMTDEHVTAQNQVVLGVAKFGDSSLAVPIAGFVGQPGGLFEIKPVLKFHVVEGTYARGEVVGLDGPGDGAVVDFTGKGDVKATVTHHADGTYTVQYGPN
ncbi:hypothetical protein PMI01_04367 [Caulobacter sp. AP07]|uniref:hypothetical protein n=1 Tax=Caulobacter sp. AP07 TaxID=1144304 RepID=UPI00027201D8|nr:hypothetical protein [Caulobacter sp. AP07]EJL25463.1 hypothetical protein PMI01_04367 [Caulobacter sp. AP07]